MEDANKHDSVESHDVESHDLEPAAGQRSADSASERALPPKALLAGARLVDGSSVDVAIHDGRISSVSPASTTARVDYETVYELEGMLLLPAPAEPHAHLDKALTAELVPNPSADLVGAIEAWIEAADAGRITYDGIVERAISAMDLLVAHGVTAVRTHANVTPETGADAVRAVLEASELFVDLLDVQVVALCSSPMTGQDGARTRAALAESLEVGAHLVGGCPHLDPDGIGAIDVALDAANDAGIGVDLHVDEMLDPSVLTLRDLARRVIDTGFEQPVTASHCVTLGVQTPEIQAEVSRLVNEAGIAVITLPQTNLFLQGRDHPVGTPRGLTALDALDDAGVLVAAGADNVQDPFNLVGRSDPLETAALLVMAGHRHPDVAYEMVSNRVRRIMGLEPVSIAVGDPADLLAVDAPSRRGAIADASRSRLVFRHGRLTARSEQRAVINRG